MRLTLLSEGRRTNQHKRNLDKGASLVLNNPTYDLQYWALNTPKAILGASRIGCPNWPEAKEDDDRSDVICTTHTDVVSLYVTEGEQSWLITRGATYGPSTGQLFLLVSTYSPPYNFEDHSYVSDNQLDKTTGLRYDDIYQWLLELQPQHDSDYDYADLPPTLSRK